MNGWPLPSRIAICQDAAKYPDLWDRLRGLWVPALFPSVNVSDLSQSKHGTNAVVPPSRDRCDGRRENGQTGEVFKRTSSHRIAIPDLTQISGTRPVGGWTIVIKSSADPYAGVSNGLVAFTDPDVFYPFEDGNLYITLLSASRVVDGDANSFDKTRWHDLTVTSQQNVAGSWNCYQNGVAIKTGGNPGDWYFTFENSQYIGYSSPHFGGRLRHVLLYNRILDLETIVRLNDDPDYTPYTAVRRVHYSFPEAAGGALLSRFGAFAGGIERNWKSAGMSGGMNQG